MDLAILVFAANSLVIIYLLFGYPLLLRVLPARKLPVKKNEGFIPSVGVVMAVHNGAEFLSQKLSNLLEMDYPRELLEIVVVSDGSTDDTDTIAQRFRDRGVQFLRVPRGGKAAALNAGIERVSADVVFFCDVRQQIDPQALRHLVANFADPTVGAVTGELRILQPESAGGEQVGMDLYWRYELWARARHSEIWSLFNTTGCLYAMRRSLCRPLPPGTLGDDAVLPLGAYLAGYRIVFDPEAIAFDYATKEGTDWRRRMRTLSGMWQVYKIYPQLLLLPHRMWLHFFSHKFGRLLLPWAVLGAMMASFFLPDSPWKWGILAAEAGLLLAALSEPWVPRWIPGRRVFSLARTFVVMNYAALLSLRVLFASSLQMWGTTKVDRAA